MAAGGGGSALLEGESMITVASLSGLEVTAHPPILNSKALCYQIPPDVRTLFVGRTDLLERLKGLFSEETSRVSITACHGLGGVGKSWIAAYYLHEETRYTHRLWFNAESLEILETQYINLLIQLRIVSPRELDSKPRSHWVQTAREYLSLREKPTLIVFDNANAYGELERFIPERCHVLITSREIDWPGTTLRVDVMTSEDAIALVRKHLGEDPSDADVRALCETVGNLPLALTQACAYIEYCRPLVTIRDYLTRYESMKRRMLEDRRLSPGHSHQNVWITFTLTMEKMREANPHSLALLYFAGFLSPDGIPLKLLERSFNSLPERVETAEAFPSAIRPLVHYSVFRHQHRHETLTIHRVLQEVIRETLKLTPDSYHAFLRLLMKVLKAFTKMGSYRMADIRLFSPYLANLESVGKHFESCSLHRQVLEDEALTKEALEFWRSFTFAYTFFQNKEAREAVQEKISACERRLYGGETLSTQEERARAFCEANRMLLGLSFFWLRNPCRSSFFVTSEGPVKKFSLRLVSFQRASQFRECLG